MTDLATTRDMLGDPTPDGLTTAIITIDLVGRVDRATASGVAYDTRATFGVGNGRRENAQGAKCSNEDEDVFHSESGIRETQTQSF